MRCSMWSFQDTRTFCALMVMPRSRSRSMESRYCARMSRASTALVSSKMRSDKVDLPWSMCAMIEKLRMRDCSMRGCFTPRNFGLKPAKILLFIGAQAPTMRTTGGRACARQAPTMRW